MPEIAYTTARFGDTAYDVIDQARAICESYAEQGYDLTLRQIYYLFVSQDLFPNDRKWSWDGNRKKWVRDPNGTKNADPNYKWLGGILNDARMAGELDWHHLVDRTRNIRMNSHWDAPRDIVRACAEQFQYDKWATQAYHVEVWIEKDALVGVLESCCPELDVPFFSCRGYTSQSEMWAAGRRLGSHIERGKKVRILHLGDHDPSGVDMTRDIAQRLATFIAIDRFHADPGWTPHDYVIECGDNLGVERVALNLDQIRAFNPPPSPAKLTDARAKPYIARFGNESWELDALDPATLVGLIRDAVAAYRDDDLWHEIKLNEDAARVMLLSAAQRWDDVIGYLADPPQDHA